MTINYSSVKLDCGQFMYIHPIGDLHVGHKQCNLKTLKEYLDLIPRTPNHRIILMGDLCDIGLKTSVGASVYENSLNVESQINKVVELLRPHAHQVDGSVMGNHEYRVSKDVGIDISSLICEKLQAPYHRYSGVVTYSLNKVAYSLAFAHGGGGGSIENSLRRCKQMTNKVTADVYLNGHCHCNAYTSRIIKNIDSRNKKLIDSKQFFVLTGHWLDYDETYADQAGFEIQEKGFPVVRLQNHTKSISVATQ